MQNKTQTLLEQIRRRHGLPALAAAVIENGQTVAVAATGYRKHGSAVADVTASDQFHLGSCTKAMTATLLGRLVEQKKLRWNTTIGDTFPDLADKIRQEYRAVTLEHLLCHRAGLPSRSWPRGKSFRDMHRLPGSPMQQRRAYVQLFLSQPAEAAPGAKFIYANAGYAIAGAMAEKVTGTPWETLMTRMLFQPLEMKTAGFGAMGTRAPGKITQPWQHTKRLWMTRPIEPGPLSDNPAVIGPAGTVHASLGDWAKFAQAHIRGARGKDGLLKAATIRKLHTPLFGGDYAFGWLVTERAWGGGRVFTHAGSNNQNFAVVWMAPLRDFAVLVATNVGGGGAAGACDQTAAALINEFLTERNLS